MSPSANRSPPNQKARTIKEHLREELTDRDDDEIYVKSRNLADSLGLSPREIGAYLRQLEEAETDITVEKWSWSRATTWRVTAAE